MYTGLLHSHRLFVILFLLLYLVKLILLLTNKNELLEKVNSKLRIPEMIISTLFLLTGIGMMFMVAKITLWLIVKIVLVAASIPIAIKGFRSNSKPIAAFSVVLIILAYGFAEMNKVGVEVSPLAAEIITQADQEGYDQLAHGLALYERNCQVCHGADGRQGYYSKYPHRGRNAFPHRKR